MKIQDIKAVAFADHCRNLAQMAGENTPETFYTGLQLFNKLRRLELKAHRLQTWSCNTGEDTTEQDERILKSVKKLLPNVSGIFINGDPRGYALKIREAETTNWRKQGVNLYQDWGGYGILAPDFN